MSSGKSKTSKIDLYYKPERRGYKEVVHFTAAETDVTKIPTAEERNKNVVDQSILRKRLIFTNDPLLHQMESQTIGSDDEVIRYTLLRTLDWKRPPDEVADYIEDKLKEQPTKKPRVLCNTEKQPRVRLHRPRSIAQPCWIQSTTFCELMRHINFWSVLAF